MSEKVPLQNQLRFFINKTVKQNPASIIIYYLVFAITKTLRAQSFSNAYFCDVPNIEFFQRLRKYAIDSMWWNRRQTRMKFHKQTKKEKSVNQKKKALIHQLNRCWHIFYTFFRAGRILCEYRRCAWVTCREHFRSSSQGNWWQIECDFKWGASCFWSFDFLWNIYGFFCKGRKFYVTNIGSCEVLGMTIIESILNLNYVNGLWKASK